MALGFAPRSALANTAVLVTPTPPAGLGGDEMWGGSVAGASHPLYSLADPFVSSSQPVSLFAASPGKSLLFRFLCRRKNVGLVLFFVLGGWKSGGTRLEVGDPKWRRCSALAAEGKRIESQQPASVPASNSMFSETPHFFFTIYSDFLFLFPALCLLFIPIRLFLSRCCALLLPCFARSSLLRTPGRQDPQCATNTPRPPPKIPPQHPESQHLGTPAPKSLL